MGNKSLPNKINQEIKNFKSNLQKYKQNEIKFEESYNSFLKMLELEKYPKIVGREISLIKTLLNYNFSLNKTAYLKQFKGNYNFKINNIDFIFKIFLIQVFELFERHNLEKKTISILKKNYKILDEHFIIFIKLYQLGIFKIYHYNIYSRTLLLLSIISDKFLYFKHDFKLKDNTIKNSMFLEFSIKLTKFLFNLNQDNVISIEEEKFVISYFEFLFKKLLSNDNYPNKHFFQKYDHYAFNFIKFSKKINNINSNPLFDILLKIYTNYFSNIPLMENFIHVIKNCLINFHLKSQNELKRNLELLNFQIKLIQSLKNKEEKFLDEVFINEGFYLGNNKSGFFTKISSKNSSRTFIFSFNFIPNNKEDISILNCQKNNNQLIFSIKIKKKLNEKKYNLNFIIAQNNIIHNIEIEPHQTYIFIIKFLSNEELSIYYIGGRITNINFKENIKLKKSISFEDFTCCLGCKIIYGENQNNFDLINTFKGYIGPFLYIQKPISNIDINNIFDLKGRYGDLIYANYNIENHKKYLDKDYFKSYNTNSYIQSIEELKKSDFLKEIIRTIYPLSFEDKYYDEIDLMTQNNKYYSFWSESTKKKMSYKVSSLKNNILINTEGDFPKLQPHEYDLIIDNTIYIFQHFNIHFHPFKIKNCIPEFLKYDGLKLISIHLEYYFQILTKLKGDKEKGNIINFEIIEIM